MSETTETTLENLDTALGTAAAGDESADVVAETQITPAEPKIDEQGRAYATGKRKNAIARVWIKPGSGVITVNGKEEEKFLLGPCCA